MCVYVADLSVSIAKMSLFEKTYREWYPLHEAAESGYVDKVRILLKGRKFDVDCVDWGLWTPLHRAAYRGHLGVVRVLISEFKADINACTRSCNTPLHFAASKGHLDVVRVLVLEFKADINTPTISSNTPLHLAALNSHLDVVRVLVSEFKADVNVQNIEGSTSFDLAVSSIAVANNCEEVAVALINEFNCDTKGGTPYMHKLCKQGWVNLVRALVQKHGTNILMDNYADNGNTPFDIAVNNHSEEMALALNEFHCDTKGGTPYIHTACERGWVKLVRSLVQKHGTGILKYRVGETTLLHKIVRSSYLHKVAVMLVKIFGTDVKDLNGQSLLHIACKEGAVSLVQTLILDSKADVTARDDAGNTPLHVALRNRSLNAVRLVQTLILDGKADVTARDDAGNTPLHVAVSSRSQNAVRLVQTLILDGKADVTARDDAGNTPLHVAVSSRSKNTFSLVQTLILDGKADVTARDDAGNTPLHVAVRSRSKNAVRLVQTLILDGKADVTARDDAGNTPLHVAARSWGKNAVNLVQALILDGKADVTARDNMGNTPLDIAITRNREDIALALIDEFGYDVSKLGRAPLHLACHMGYYSLVTLISKRSPSTLWMVDEIGDTPLHVCASLGKTECVKALLELNPPVMVRNSLGKTPKDVAEKNPKSYRHIEVYMTENKDKIKSHYDLHKHAKKKYSLPEPITRTFVLGYPGAGKSSLVETLKREGFLDSFKRVSESSVLPHTAGIVPSIHTSKHYGRVLFYDFAGDAEYYSSHAAILENLASSRKGDNVFLLVIDMREQMAEIKKVFYYWFSFIQHQQFQRQKPRLIVVGSHLDLLTEDVAKARGKEFQMFYDSIDTEAVQMSALFMLDCCKPRSKQITELQTLMSRLTKDSPRFELSFQASILLGLVEKDFSNVPACNIQTLLTHIEETGTEIPTDTLLFHPILLELHDLGLLFLIDSSIRESSSVVLNMSQLTNIVHKSLFSKKTVLKTKFEERGLSFSFSAGIVPLSILAKILPENITKECLVQLQYCQEISHAEAHVFPSLKVSDSTDLSFLFFPALCSADKSEVAKEGATPPDLNYGIGWLGRCTDPYDYLSPRFHHILMLRLVFKFTLSAHPPADQVSNGSPDLSHFQRRCTVWKTGVHWLMEEGVECMVELANANKKVVVLTRSTKDGIENCATVFNNIVSCVMEAKAEFCHSVRLEFFLLDSTSEADYHSVDNLFAMRDVERVLMSEDGGAKVNIVSTSGNQFMARSKVVWLRNFTLWYSLFPMDFKSVLDYIKDVVRELYMLGLHLGIPKGILDAIEVENRTDVGKMRRELVKGWMSSSLDPPCWWHLVRALHKAESGTLADKIAQEFGKFMVMLL